MADTLLLFKFILIAEFCLFSILRIIYYQRARKAGSITVIEESKWYAVFLSVFIIYEVATFFIYIFIPQLFIWSTFDLPSGLRWFGVLLGIAALLLFFWVHTTLGYNFSATLKIKGRHTLITNGPYHWVRHPMYMAFYLLHIAVFFLTANWFIGITWLGGLTVTILLRVNREEAMMIGKFGEEYRSYMRRTGQFLPYKPLKFPIRSRDDIK